MKTPFKGDVERARNLLKQEKRRNEEIPENSPLKMKVPLITGKTKAVHPTTSTMNRKGSFSGNSSLLHLNNASSTPTSKHSSKGSMSVISTKDKKASLESIDEDDYEPVVKDQIKKIPTEIERKLRPSLTFFNSPVAKQADRRASLQTDHPIKKIEVKSPKSTNR